MKWSFAFLSFGAFCGFCYAEFVGASKGLASVALTIGVIYALVAARFFHCEAKNGKLEKAYRNERN